jgi:hypothetical protein
MPPPTLAPWLTDYIELCKSHGCDWHEGQEL